MRRGILGPSFIFLLLISVSFAFAYTPGTDPVYQYIQNPVYKSFGLGSGGFIDVAEFSGAGVYSYEIKIPDGTNSLAPTISLFYNSHSSKSLGIMGSGWKITESYIERDINYTASDISDDEFNLVLDGSFYELIYDPVGKRFHTRIESYLHIENKTGGDNENDVYFVVRSKSGRYHQFGYDEKSELVSDSTGLTNRWSLDLVNDTYGNHIYYNYTENIDSDDEGAVYLDTIEYNDDRLRLIEFEYEDSAREDVRISNSNGIRVLQNRRLENITISHDSSLVRRYNFEYSDVGTRGLSFLENITEYGNDDLSSLPPTKFEYYEEVHSWTGAGNDFKPAGCFLQVDGDSTSFRMIDVNGDGLDDMVYGYETLAGCNTEVYINQEGNFVGSSSFELPGCLIDEGVDNGYRFVDVNGDGLVDIIRGKASNPHDCTGSPSHGTWINNGTHWNNHAADNWGEYCFTGSTGRDFGYRFLDLDGDGFTDLKRGVSGFSDGGSCASTSGGTHQTYVNNGTHMVSTAGDAWGEHCFVGSSGNDLGYRFADANGDGLVDLFYGKTRSSGICNAADTNVVLNNGSAFSESFPNDVGCIVDQNYRDWGKRLVDVSGDGLVDVISGKGSDSWCSTWGGSVSLNNGTGWAGSDYGVLGFCTVDGNFNDNGYRFGEVNGDGRIDLLYGKEGYGSPACGTGNKGISLNDQRVSHLLKRVNTSSGGVDTISYVSSAEFDNTGDDERNDLTIPLNLVANITRDDGLGNVYVTVYNYSGGFYDYSEKDFRGFGLTEENIERRTLQRYHHQTDSLRGKQYEEVYYEDGNLFFRTINYWTNSTDSSGSYIALLKNTTEILVGSSNNKTVRAHYAYDDNGDVTYMYNEGEVGNTLDDYYSYFEYVENTGLWIIGAIKKVYTLDTDNSTLIRETNYTYDKQNFGDSPLKGSITKEVYYLDTGANPEVEYSYDSYGNMVNSTDAEGNFEEYTYESTNTFVNGTTDSKGFITNYTYDVGIGEILTVLTSNGDYFNSTYDEFGRPLTEIAVYDSVNYPTKNYTYYYDGDAPESIKISSRETGGGNGTYDEIQFFDGQGRVVQVKKEGTDSRHIIVDTYFDELGRIQRTSNPYFASFDEDYTSPDTSVSGTNYSYDVFDRVTLKINPDGTEVETVYSLWNVTFYDENDNRIDHVLDFEGRILIIREYNGDEIYNTTYTYDSQGNLTSIVDNEGNVWNYTWDTLARKVAGKDPDTGWTNYTYDKNGNIIEQISGGGDLISGDGLYREYNSLGQLVAVRDGDASGDLIENYTYDGNGDRIKTYNHEKDETVYTPFKEFRQVRNTTGIFNFTYIYAGDQLVARINPDGSKHFYHSDHLGSTSLITNSTGDVVEDTVYLPYGSVLDGGSAEDLLYEGKELDETGQYYYGARYYDPRHRLFVQPDQIIPNPYDPQQLNIYAFERGNPYAYTDPTGNFVCGGVCIVGAVLIAIDVASFVHSAYEFHNDPSAENAALLGADILLPSLAGAGLKAGAKGAKITGFGDEAGAAFKNIFGPNLRGTYSPQYQSKLSSMYSRFSGEGFEFTEHALNRVAGNLNSGRIKSLDSVSDALKSGTRYADDSTGNIVYSKGGINVHVTDGNKVTTVTEGKIKDKWRLLDE